MTEMASAANPVLSTPYSVPSTASPSSSANPSPLAPPRSPHLLCHVHSHYSLLEGVDSPEVLVQRAAACGYEALALTDTNNLYGAVAFVEAARKHGVRPILGACLRGQGDTGTRGQGDCRVRRQALPVASRLTGTADAPYTTSVRVLIAEPAGYTSLCRIISRLHLRKEPVLVELLVENPEGLHVLVDQIELALRLRETFGDRLWLEIVRPAASGVALAPRESVASAPRVFSGAGVTRGADATPLASSERELLDLAQRLNLKPVASVAVHFATPAGYSTFRLVTAIRLGMLLDRLPKVLAITPAHHLVDPETLHHRFRDLPEAVVNTQLLASQCRSDVLPRGITLPPAKVPRALGAAEYLRRLCERGLRQLVNGQGDKETRGQGERSEVASSPCLLVPSSPSPYQERLAEELHVVKLRDLAGYFLVVRDIARYARRRGFSMALRGSAGNSLICYLLGITNVDPLRFQLPLERFLHVGRPDLPDIDLDFDWKVRDQVIAWTFERYGHAHTAMISSHLFLQPASAFREAGKVHGLSNEQISQLLEVWERGGYSKWEGASAEGWEKRDQGSGVGGQRAGIGDCGLPIADCESIGNPQSAIGNSPPPGFPLEPSRWPRLLADAQRLIGRPHHLSIHPGGIVVTPKPIEDYVPLQRAAKGIVITQLDKDPIERIGLVKIDLLGNRALATVDETRRLLRSMDKGTRGQGDKGTKKRQADTESQEPLPIPLSPCPLVPLSLLQTGDTLGLNQLESPAMRHLLVQMQPQGLIDVIQALALIRPGAASIGAKERFVRRRRGLEPTVYDHPKLEPLLADTCGLMLYEDDALGVVQALTGFSAPEADHFRKRVTKCTDPQEALALSKAFLKACAQHGVDRDAASNVWVQLAKFNNYSFCKSHAVSYGLIAWEAVRLKAEQPLAFWCAALNNNQGMYPRRVYIEAIKRAGIQVLLPCVNRSQREFALETLPGFFIRTGLAIIHGLDEAAREAILDDRSRHGPFADFADFCRRVSVGAEMLALLIQVGAFDFTGRTRPELLLEAEMSAIGHRLAAFGQKQLPIADGRQPIADWSPTDFSQPRRWKEEWERLGFLAGPPLMSLFRPYLPKNLATSRDLPKLVGKRVCITGLVATARHATTKHGQTMQFMTLQDEWGFMDVTFFPGTFPAATYLGLGPYLVWGTVEEQYDVITVTATRFQKQAIAPWAGS